MSHSFNYTGRELILPRHAVIQVSKPSTANNGTPQTVRIKALIQFEDNYKFPPEAPLIVEAYNYLYYKRFEYGTVGNPKPPPGADMYLDTDEWEGLLFRVKVIDPLHSGRILGEADRLCPVMAKSVSGDEGGGNRPLLSIAAEELGQQVWTIRFDVAGPTVIVNKANLELRRRIEEPPYRWLVFPEVLQRILERIIYIEGALDEGQAAPEGWQSLWLSFAKDLFEAPPPPSEDPKEDRLKWAEWIDDVVRRLCERHNALDAFSKALTDEVGQ